MLNNGGRFWRSPVSSGRRSSAGVLLFLVGARQTCKCLHPVVNKPRTGHLCGVYSCLSPGASCTSSLKTPHLQHLKDDRNSIHEPITTVEVSLSDLRKCREGEPARFLVVSRDSAGEQMTRGGEHVMVSIVHKEKKNW